MRLQDPAGIISLWLVYTDFLRFARKNFKFPFGFPLKIYRIFPVSFGKKDNLQQLFSQTNIKSNKGTPPDYPAISLR